LPCLHSKLSRDYWHRMLHRAALYWVSDSPYSSHWSVLFLWDNTNSPISRRCLSTLTPTQSTCQRIASKSIALRNVMLYFLSSSSSSIPSTNHWYVAT
jgi:hypothetical protein